MIRVLPNFAEEAQLADDFSRRGEAIRLCLARRGRGLEMDDGVLSDRLDPRRNFGDIDAVGRRGRKRRVPIPFLVRFQTTEQFLAQENCQKGANCHPKQRPVIHTNCQSWCSVNTIHLPLRIRQQFLPHRLNGSVLKRSANELSRCGKSTGREIWRDASLLRPIAGSSKSLVVIIIGDAWSPGNLPRGI